MLPKVNQTMFIQTPGKTGAEQAPIYRSRVADLNEAALFIEVPLEEKSGRYYRATPGEELQVTYYTTEGVRHQFAATVNGLHKDAVTLLELRMPGAEEIARDQRRNFLRVEAQLELAVRMGEKVRFLSLTEDVGGGGVSFRCERKWPIQAGQKLNCWLLIPFRSGSLAHSQFTGEVVRVKETEPHHYQVMMKFAEIAENDQQKVIRYCFERQLDFRKE